jgi:hypothetical protein
MFYKNITITLEPENQSIFRYSYIDLRDVIDSVDVLDFLWTDFWTCRGHAFPGHALRKDSKFCWIWVNGYQKTLNLTYISKTYINDKMHINKVIPEERILLYTGG